MWRSLIWSGPDLAQIWRPFTELGGKVNFKNIVEGDNVREETDKVIGNTQMFIVESSITEKRTPSYHQGGQSGEERKYPFPKPAQSLNPRA